MCLRHQPQYPANHGNVGPGPASAEPRPPPIPGPPLPPWEIQLPRPRSEPAPPRPSILTRSRLLLLAALTVAALAAFAVFGWRLGYVPTSEARADAPASTPPLSAPSPTRIRAEGRLVTYPGAQVVVGTEIGGTIVELLVHEKSVVKKGDRVAVFNADETRAALREAKAAVHASNARAGFLVKEARRLKKLQKADAVPRRSLDAARSERNSAFGQTAVALAAADRFKATLAKATVVAPIDGTVIACHAEQGETVPPGAKLVTIADLTRVRVEVEVDEFDVGKFEIGAAVTVRAEAFGERSWTARVEEIPDALVAKRLKPKDPSRPLDMRVLLVKVALDEPTPLKLGQRLEVEISASDESQGGMR